MGGRRRTASRPIGWRERPGDQSARLGAGGIQTALSTNQRARTPEGGDGQPLDQSGGENAPVTNQLAWGRNGHRTASRPIGWRERPWVPPTC